MAGRDELADIPQGKLSALLSGLGFYRLSVQRRKLLTYFLAGSLVAHVIGLAMFGGWVVMRSRRSDVAIFTTPPPSRTYKPRELEHRVKLQKRQRSSSRPAMMPRMASMKLSNLALPEIKIDPKIIHTTFQPKFKAVSGKGLGAGLGTGYGTHGFGSGVSTIDFFGIRARGERIAILVDVSVSMVEEERGGIAGYMRVKQRVERVIEALSEMSMFSVIVFADAASTMEEKMLVANGGNKKNARLYVRPFNAEGNWGLTTGNVKASRIGVQAGGGTTRLDLALTQAMRQFADTILIISDGLPKVEKILSAKEAKDRRQAQRDWHNEHAAEIAAWEVANAAFMAPANWIAEKVWVEAKPATVPDKKPPLKEGQAPSQAQGAVVGHWRSTRRYVGRLREPGPRPALPEIGPDWWTLADFAQHLSILHEHLYEKKGKKMPAIHCIGYQIDDAGGAFLRKLAKQHHGQYRRVQRMR